MKKSDNFLSDFLFFVGVVAQVEIWEGCEEWEGCEGCDGWGKVRAASLCWRCGSSVKLFLISS